MARPVSTSLTLAQQAEAVSMLALGSTNAQVAGKLGCSPKTIQRLRQREETKALITELSERVKRMDAEALVEASPKLHAFALTMIQAGDARDVDAAFRAWLNAAKIRSLVSGEMIPPRQQPQPAVVVRLTWWASRETLRNPPPGVVIEQAAPALPAPPASPWEPARAALLDCRACEIIGEPCSLHSRPEPADG